MNRQTQHITIIGAGLVGSMLSIYLGQRGYTVDVYEKLPDIRQEKISAGRSINLALANRGIRPLQQLGIFAKVEKLLTPMKGRMLHDHNGNLQFQNYGQKPQEVIYSVSRGGLVALLRDEAEATKRVKFHFKQSLEAVDFGNKKIRINDQNHAFDVLIGADGAGSKVRNTMSQAGVAGVSFAKLDHSYKELTIAAGANKQFLMDENALHIWPRGQYMLIALPNLDASFTVTLFLPSTGETSFASLQTAKDVDELFARQFKDAKELMPNLTKMFFANPTGTLGTIRCQHWQHKDALLIGDAAHAVVPFHGQGMNCGFEDCFELNALLQQHADDWSIVTPLYCENRKANANAIADMALENYIEMRDSVRDTKFQLKKHIAFALEKHFPDVFIPRYSMVMFHHIPYAQAQKRGTIQAAVLEELSSLFTSKEQFDAKIAEQILIKHNLIKT